MLNNKEPKNYRCTLKGKGKYTRREAKGHVQATWKKAKKMLYIYKCPDCRYYHLTRNVQ